MVKLWSYCKLRNLVRPSSALQKIALASNLHILCKLITISSWRNTGNYGNLQLNIGKCLHMFNCSLIIFLNLVTLLFIECRCISSYLYFVTLQVTTAPTRQMTTPATPVHRVITAQMVPGNKMRILVQKELLIMTHMEPVWIIALPVHVSVLKEQLLHDF